MPSKREIEAHLKRLVALRKQADRLDDDTVRQIFVILRDTRARIGARIVSETGFELAFLQRFQTAVNQAFEEFRVRMQDIIASAKPGAVQLGASLVDEPLIAAGARISVSALPRIDPAVLQKQLQRGTQFIQNLSVEAANMVNTELLIGLQGGQTPNQVMQNIGQSITRGRFKTIATRAEFITRTEINSALNQATTARLEQARQQIPGMRKFWMHAGDTSNPHARGSHIALWRATDPSQGGVPLTMGRKFNVNGVRAAGPHDDALPPGDVINCRCRLGTTIEQAQIEPAQQRLFA